MAAILQKVIRGYIFLFDDLADQRLISWPFVSKPYQITTVVALYLMYVLKWGPEWMKNRKPFNLDKIMIVYNALQVLSCAYMFHQALYVGWGWDYRWVCEPVNFSDTPAAVGVAKLTYLYLLTKLFDLLDTVFFVLRKKNNQVSFLHLYHHAGMVLLTWVSVTYLPGGHPSLIGVLNCLVHVVMYSYYLLSVAAPNVKNMIWMKKIITQLQILQFFCAFIHLGSLILAKECEYPRWTAACLLPHNFFIVVLFTDFYIKTYNKRPKLEEATNKTVSGNNNNDHNKMYNDDNGIEHNGNENHDDFLTNRKNVYEKSIYQHGTQFPKKKQPNKHD